MAKYEAILEGESRNFACRFAPHGVIRTALMLFSGFLLLSSSALADVSPEQRLQDEIAAMPAPLKSMVVDHSARLIANSADLSKQDIADCSSFADFTLEVFASGKVELSEYALLKQFIKSRAWTGLYLHRQAQAGAMPLDSLQAQLSAAKSTNDTANIIQSGNIKCDAFLRNAAGTVKIRVVE